MMLLAAGCWLQLLAAGAVAAAVASPIIGQFWLFFPQHSCWGSSKLPSPSVFRSGWNRCFQTPPCHQNFFIVIVVVVIDVPSDCIRFRTNLGRNLDQIWAQTCPFSVLTSAKKSSERAPELFFGPRAWILRFSIVFDEHQNFEKI